MLTSLVNYCIFQFIFKDGIQDVNQLYIIPLILLLHFWFIYFPDTLSPPAMFLMIANLLFILSFKEASYNFGLHCIFQLILRQLVIHYSLGEKGVEYVQS